MSISLTEFSSKEGLDEFPREFRVFGALPQTKDIHVIILNGLMGSEMVVNQAGASVWTFIGAYRPVAMGCSPHIQNQLPDVY